MPLLPSALRRIAHTVWARSARAQFERADPCRLFALDLVVAPGVFHPAHFRSSRVLAEKLLTLDLHGKRLADLGTGSGLLALLAARQGAQVTAVDVSPKAVACARENARRNRLEKTIDVMVSDLFEGVPPHATFDVVVTNPPFYPRAPRNSLDHAFAAGEGHSFFVKLAASLRERLNPLGCLLLVSSSDTDFAPIARLLAAAGLDGGRARERPGWFETLTVREFRATQRT